MESDDKGDDKTPFDPRLDEMNDPYVFWRCPCVDIPECHNKLFQTI